MRRVQVLANPTARGGCAFVEQVVAVLRDREIEAVVLEPVSRAAAIDEARQAVVDGAERLIVVGGDGVVNIAVNAVAETDVVLGIIPFGTGNDFARAVGLLDGTLVEQVSRSLGDAKPIDLIRSDHGWVASVATLGFSGDVTARANALSWPRGQHRYTVATLLQLPRLRTLAAACEVDGHLMSTDTTLLAVGNTAYFGGGMRICPDARPDDGQIQVVNIGGVPRRTFLRVFPTVFSGRHVRRKEVTTAVGRCVRLEGDHIDLWADGEHLGSLPVTLELVPGALKLAGVRSAG